MKIVGKIILGLWGLAAMFLVVAGTHLIGITPVSFFRFGMGAAVGSLLGLVTMVVLALFFCLATGRDPIDP